MFQGVPDGCKNELVRACRAVATYLNLGGRHKEAAKTIEVVLILKHKHLGITDIDYLANLTELAETHALQGKLARSRRPLSAGLEGETRNARSNAYRHSCGDGSACALVRSVGPIRRILFAARDGL